MLDRPSDPVSDGNAAFARLYCFSGKQQQNSQLFGCSLDHLPSGARISAANKMSMADNLVRTAKNSQILPMRLGHVRAICAIYECVSAELVLLIQSA